MELTDVQRLTKDYDQSDTDEIAAVMQSTLQTTPSAIIRWSNVRPEDAQAWLEKVCEFNHKRDFHLRRISTMHDPSNLPTEVLAEHLVVRDLNCPRLNSSKDDMDTSAGRIVAHADFRFAPSFGEHIVHPESQGPPFPFPSGFGKDLQIHIDREVETTLTDLFQGLPCFELAGISTLTPSHIRKGIAKRLVEWIYPYAEQFSLPVVLSGSPLGLPLYRKCGFEEYRKYDIVIDLTQYGGEEIHRHVIMVRWPQDISRLPSVWRDWRDAHVSDRPSD